MGYDYLLAMRLRFAGAALVSVCAGCAQEVHSVGNIFKPLATPAEAVYHLSILTLAICGVIFAVVAGLIAYAIIRFRDRGGNEGAEPAQVYGSNQIEIAWTVIPILIVFVLVMSTARVTSAIQDHRAPPDALRVTVIGHQWWWEFRYPELNVVTANELHVPVSKVTLLRLESADVAHSFWVPQLSGKTDLIPNRINNMWIDPREPGIYLGNCAEYCGTQHANMLLRVVAESPEDFAKWIAQQKLRAANSAQAEIFLSLSCINCHTVSGTAAAGKFGPDLTHLMSRKTLASGAIPNDPEHLRKWIKDPQEIKPGNMMPDMQLSEKELDQVVAYLSSLQ